MSKGSFRIVSQVQVLVKEMQLKGGIWDVFNALSRWIIFSRIEEDFEALK